MQEVQVQSLGWEDPLEEEMATYSSILAWEIPRTEGPGRLQSMGLQRVGHDWATDQQLQVLSLFGQNPESYFVCVCVCVWILRRIFIIKIRNT